MKDKSNILIFTLFFSLLVNISFALSPLPKNAFLRLGDNQIEVKNLQEILNSDIETEIADVGPGSPGNESWYFGIKTENALVKFQTKYNLEPTGELDFVNIKLINSYVDAYNTGEEIIFEPAGESPEKEIQDKIKDADERRKQLNEQNKKDFQEALKAKEDKKKDSEKENSDVFSFEDENPFLDEPIDKYLGSNSSEQKNIDASQKNTENPQNPYLDPNNQNLNQPNPFNPNQPNPFLNPNQFSFGQGSPFGSGQNPFSPNNNANIFPQPQPSLLGGLMQGLGNRQGPSFIGGSVGPGNFNEVKGKPSAKQGVIYEEDNWVYGDHATDFGCKDKTATRYFGSGANSNANKTSMQHLSTTGSIPIEYDCSLFLIALPLEIQRYYFGNLPIEQLKNAAAGTPFEVVYPMTKLCTVVPLWETGPGTNERGNIDLTKAVKFLLQIPSAKNKKGDTIFDIVPLRFRPVPKGARGCEGYNFIDPNNRNLNIPMRTK